MSEIDPATQKTETTQMPGAGAPTGVAIADKRFFAQLSEIKKIKEFFFQQKLSFDATILKDLDLEILNNLIFSATGRAQLWKNGNWSTKR